MLAKYLEHFYVNKHVCKHKEQNIEVRKILKVIYMHR